MKKKTKMLNLITPNVQTIHVGTGLRQEAKYLQLPDGLCSNDLQEDLKNGAEIYASLPDSLQPGETKYSIILAPSEEDGLRAVAYLAGCHADSAGITIENNSSPLGEDEADPEKESDFDFQDDSFSFDMDENEIFSNPGNAFGEDFTEDGEKGYMESNDRIAIIAMNDLINEENRCHSDPFSPFQYQMSNQFQQQAPWWANCTSESICIIKNTDTATPYFYGEFSSDILSPIEINALHRFSGNECVYLVVVAAQIGEMDFSINSCMLEYTANCFRLSNDKQKLNAYRTILLENSAREHGFSFSKNLDLSLMADKLSLMNPQYPSNNFDKIMDYLKHINAPQKLSYKDFEPLGLSKIIEMASLEKKGTSLEQDLVGMEQVKKQVNSVINVLRYNRKMEKEHLKNGKYHNVHLFIGAPGTAKTTVAQLMTNMMFAEGLLPGSRFTSVTGAQLKGMYVGHTAPKVHALFQENDAILIDEAYSLSVSDHGEMDIFAQEALAQLAVELEQHATDKLVIFAGYGGKSINPKNNLMYQFLQANPGIRSRIGSTITFQSYSPNEMLSIVKHLAKNSSLTLPTDCDEQIKSYFATRQSADDFGNGREARVFLEQCERCLAERVMSADQEPTKQELTTITVSDVTSTIEELTYSRLSQLGQTNGKLGFI